MDRAALFTMASTPCLRVVLHPPAAEKANRGQSQVFIPGLVRLRLEPDLFRASATAALCLSAARRRIRDRQLSRKRRHYRTIEDLLPLRRSNGPNLAMGWDKSGHVLRPGNSFFIEKGNQAFTDPKFGNDGLTFSFGLVRNV